MFPVVNYALNKTVDDAGFTAPGNLCTDGDVATACHSSWSNKQWIKIDLETSHEILFIQIVARGTDFLDRINGMGIYIGNKTTAHENDLFVVVNQTSNFQIYENTSMYFSGRFVFVHYVDPKWKHLNFREIRLFGKD